jgi:uncharacterized protein YebE (UPF0316 family)
MSVIDTLFAGPWGPLVIFGLRIFDVSFSTVRVLLSVRNVKLAVPLIGFFEVMIWLFAVGNAVRHLDSFWHVLGYAAGFATGSIVGLWIEEKLAFGWATLQIISRYGGVEVAEALRELGYGVTEFAGQGRDGTVEVVYTVLKRRQLPEVFRVIDQWDPEAFVMIDEPRAIRRGWLYNTPRQRVGAGLFGLKGPISAVAGRWGKLVFWRS